MTKPILLPYTCDQVRERKKQSAILCGLRLNRLLCVWYNWAVL